MKILSYGGGVNSTAILALIKLGRYPMPDKIIFCDTGAEMPETICYVKYMQTIFPIQIIQNWKWTLLEQCRKYRVTPSRQNRWCTIQYKTEPTKQYMGLIGYREYFTILGFASDERQRMKDDSTFYEYPLIDMGLARIDCMRTIKEAGWILPRKSGCWICPYMRKDELQLLAQEHKDLFDQLVKLEKDAHDRNKKIYFKDNVLIPEYISADYQPLLDGFDNYQGCVCKAD